MLVGVNWKERGLCKMSESVAQRRFTDKQGQYLAFIFYYTKIHGCAPAEADMQQYFKVSPPRPAAIQTPSPAGARV